MSPLSRILRITASLCVIVASSVYGQTYQTLTTFTGVNGSVPTDALVQGSDGNFYGTTQYGGKASNGTVFRITPAGALTTLYNFCSKTACVDGSMPIGGLEQGSDGSFYGATSAGGAFGQGTIFKITVAGSLSTLHSFCSLSGCADGEAPRAGLIQGKDGNFYGTTAGNLQYAGNVFKITPTGTLTTLYTFCSRANCADGYSPESGLIQATDGNFYGNTSQGGAFGSGGTIFRITPTGTLTTLYNFCSLADCADGSSPYAALLQASDGNLYGTTVNGGTVGAGTAFKLTPSGQLSTLHSFCSSANCTDGEYPYAELIEGTDGNFYGTTEAGGTQTNHSICIFGCGTIFQLTPAGSLSTLYNMCFVFTCPDGAQPFAGVIQTSNGTLYGTTAYGGACSILSEGCGTVFSWSANVPLAPTFNPTSIIYGNHAIDTSKQRSIELININSGYSILDISKITITGSSDYVISSNGCPPTLAAGKNCNIFITFTPTILGNDTATLNVFDNAPGSPQTAQLSGAGVLQATLTPTSVTFPNTKVGSTSNPKSIVLKNNLPTTLTGIAYKISSQFSVSSTTCTTTLASNASCSFLVVFSPTVTGTVNGTFSVKDSANNSPQTTTLTGTGT